MTVSDTLGNRAILKSTVLLGGSSIVVLFFGMIRTKVVAVLLGPSGVGFLGILSNLQQVVTTVSGMGIATSGVQRIADANGRNDTIGEVRIISTLRFLILATGTVGFLIMSFGARLWSRLSFGVETFAVSVAIVGIGSMAALISSGQLAIMQGRRQTANVALASVYGSILATIIAIPCYLFLGNDGIAPSLALTAIASLAVSWSFARKAISVGGKLIPDKAMHEAQKLIYLGLPLMLAGLGSTAVNYLIRIYISRKGGLEAVGHYQAAFNLGGSLVSFILAAMGTDYYPRLSAVSSDAVKMNKEVNAQTEIAVLLALPALIATIVLMPFVVQVFYSSSFTAAIPILQWTIIGVLGKVISWPLAFIILAKSKGLLFLFTETLAGAILLFSTIFFYRLFGLQGCGIAYAVLYIAYSVIVMIVASVIANTSWTKGNVRLVIIAILVVASLSLLMNVNMYPVIRYLLGGLYLGISTMICYRRLCSITQFSFSTLLRKLSNKK